MSAHDDAAVKRQPPFPPAGTGGEPHDRHARAEAFVNAGAQHAFPGAAPESSLGEGDTVARTDQSSSSDQPTHAEREEQALIQGTPLEEMKAYCDESAAANRQDEAGDVEKREKHDSGKTAQLQARQEVGRTTGQQTGSGARTRHPKPIRSASGSSPDMGSIRMGTSALVSLMQNMPWSDESDDDSGDDDLEDRRTGRTGQSVMADTPARPKVTRLHSSLQTIRSMDVSGGADGEGARQRQTLRPPSSRHLSFPFRDNTIARRARSPGRSELEYQYALTQDGNAAGSVGDVPPPRKLSAPSRKSSAGSSETGSLDLGARALVAEQVEREETRGDNEEVQEKARLQAAQQVALEPVLAPEAVDAIAEEPNTEAALDEGDEDAQVIGDRMQITDAEKRRLRKEKLAERLQEVFGLEQREEVLEEMRCWLLRSIMLKGYMYLTRRHICFFAHMPDKANAVVKTGPLYKKASRTKLNNKYWVVLRNDVLSWYESTNDPYFPKGNVSLQYASSCDPVDDNRFKLRTSERTYTFSADTEQSRDEWVRAIEKVMFKTQHEGESVKLIIPLEAVDEVERSPTLEFAETLEIRVVDSDDAMSIDSYFFASFQDNDYAFQAIQRILDERPSSTLPRVPSGSDATQTPQQPKADSASQSSSSLPHFGLNKLGSVLRPLLPKSGNDEPTNTEARSSITAPLRHKSSRAVDDSTIAPTGSAAVTADSDSEQETSSYPPRQTGPPPPGMEEQHGKWNPTWIRKPAAKLFGSSPAHRASFGTDASRRRASVTEVVETSAMSSNDESDDDVDRRRRSKREAARLSFSSATSAKSEGIKQSQSDYSMVEKSQMGEREEEETAQQFRSVFALSDKEELIDHFPGYLYRVLPVSGRFFVSTNYFCFRSSQLLYKTKMIIPIRDLYGLKAQKAFRFGHKGLIVVVKGHEELFLEFSSSSRRRACIALLEERMEAVRLTSEGRDRRESDPSKLEARILEDLDESHPVEQHFEPATEPSPLFGSTTSTFLEFKPDPMRVTCLTIGSRGDVQPYIALCKGLQAEGHTVRIASHGEYKDWVEGHGIEFASVGGDPAELMKMCVDNGMFTVSFLKEGLQKFRGWLDDLLNSSWEACQGSDLLIESPSAMGGTHIAEALRIPYMRAFTMPWTRTRAYPHAFAVPEHKRGGSYNYMTYTMFDQVFWRAISGQINRWRRQVLHIDSTTFDKLEQHKVPFLYNFSPTVVPPPLDWTEWIHVTGYWFLENADESAKEKKWNPPDGLLDFIDGAHKNGKKVVYIGFGSIVVSDPQEMTRCVVDAVKEAGVCAILSKGWSERGSKEKSDDNGEEADGIKFPPEIFSINSIDHSWLFPRIDAACHHGGAGTSGASLRAGIPTIIKPFFGDQAFWAERVESLGVGTAIRKLTTESLAEALKRATGDEKQVAKAKIIGETIRKENGVATAIEAIYRDLEYAKSLIKPLPAADSTTGGPLDKVSSTLLHPLKSVRSSDTTPDAENRSQRARADSRLSDRSQKAHGRARSDSSPHKSTDPEGMTSDDSWAVLSDSERPHEGDSDADVVRSHTRDRSMSTASGMSESSGGEGGSKKGKSVPGLGALVGHLMPAKLSKQKSAEHA